MNIHPFFVHFPIAFLVLYAIFELIRFKAIQELSYWFYIKATLVISGTIFAYMAVAAGEIAEGIVSKEKPYLRPLIETHSNYAGIATLVFSIISFGYFISWLEKIFGSAPFENKILAKITYFVLKLKHLIIETKIILALALVGLITIIITGALGASIVYGPDIDPFVKIIYSLVVGK